MSQEVEGNYSVISSSAEHVRPSQANYQVIGRDKNTIDSLQSGDAIFPNTPQEVSKDRGHLWRKVYEPSMNKKKGRQRLGYNMLKILRFSWSFSVVFLVMLLASLVVVGVSLWLSNHFLIRRGVRQVANIQRDLLTLRVLNHLQDFVASGPNVVQSLIKELEWGDRSGLNFSDSRNDKSRKIQQILLFSQLKNPKITTAWYGTRYDYFIVVMVNDTISVPPEKFVLGLSNGDGIVSNYPMNSVLDVSPRPVDVQFGFFPTKRPWYLIAEKTRAIQWAPIFFTLSLPAYLTIPVSGPYFDVNDGSLYGVVTASINLQILSDFLRSLVVFPETRLYVVQSDMALVAVNKGTILNDTDPRKNQMVDARNSTDFVIRESAEIIVRTLGVPLVVDDREFIGLKFVDSTGKKRDISIIGFRDNFGLRWNLISVLSEAVVLKVVNKSNRVLAIVTICTIIGALLIALVLSVMISVPLSEIAGEFAKITKMNFKNRKSKIHPLSLFEIAVMTQSIKQLKNGLRCFDAYVPSDVVRVLMSRNTSARLGVVRKRITIMFMETKLEDTDGFSPNLLVDMLQVMFTSFSQIVTDEGGVVDKYIPEGIMCLFNAPLSIDDHELRSIRACFKIHQSVRELNQEWKSKNRPAISVRIGVNTDMCFVGNVGSRTRVNYTALGDAVNVASRLMSLNKRYETSTMIGPKTKEAVQDHFVCRWISFVCVKGKSQPIHVFEVLCEREKSSEEQKELESATYQVKQLIEENNLNSSLNLVLKLLSEYPRDEALIELRERLESPNFCPYVEVGSK